DLAVLSAANDNSGSGQWVQKSPVVAFGTRNAGTTSGTTNVQLTSVGTASLNVTGITLTGANAAQFALVAPTSGSPTCSIGASSIAVGNSCFVGIQYRPLVSGAHTASVSVADDAANSPQTLALSGTATGVPIASVSPASPFNYASHVISTSTP